MGFNVPLHPRRRLCWCSGFLHFHWCGVVSTFLQSCISFAFFGNWLPYTGCLDPSSWGMISMVWLPAGCLCLVLEEVPFRYSLLPWNLHTAVWYLAWDFVIHFRLMTRSYNDWWYPIPCANLITALWVIMIRFGKFSFRFLLLSSFFLVRCSCRVCSAGFSWVFSDSRCSCFSLVALPPPLLLSPCNAPT